MANAALVEEMEKREADIKTLTLKLAAQESDNKTLTLKLEAVTEHNISLGVMNNDHTIPFPSRLHTMDWSLSDALFEGLEQSAAMRKRLGQALKARMEAKAASETCDNCSASCASGSLVGPSRNKREPASVPADSQHPANQFVSGLRSRWTAGAGTCQSSARPARQARPRNSATNVLSSPCLCP